MSDSTHQDQSPNGTGRVPLGTVLSYGPPIVGISALLFFVQFFFLKFATDVFLMAPATVGLLFALGRVWDAVSDPIVGTWSDRTRTRLGRRRPWMLAAIPAIVLVFPMIWAPPEGLEGTALTVWVTVALFAFYTAYTAYIIPHTSLGAELTHDHHDRSRVFGVRHAFFMLGIMCAFGGMQFVENAEDPRAAAATLALVAVFTAAVILIVPPTFIRERKEYQGRGAQSSFGAMADVLRNPHARIFLFVTFFEIGGTSVLGIVSPYLIVYILKRPDLIGILPALFLVCSVVSIPFWVRASKRFGKRRAWTAAMFGLALSFASSIFVGPGDVALLAIILVAGGISAGCGGAIGMSILADVIDYDESVSGERKEGSYAAAHGFVLKAANALIILTTGLVLQFSGFEPNVEQTATASLAISGLFAGLPCAAFIIGGFLLSRFRLDADEHQRIRTALDTRAE